MTQIYLKLNEDKTEIVIFGSRANLRKLDNKPKVKKIGNTTLEIKN